MMTEWSRGSSRTHHVHSQVSKHGVLKPSICSICEGWWSDRLGTQNGQFGSRSGSELAPCDTTLDVVKLVFGGHALDDASEGLQALATDAGQGMQGGLARSLSQHQ